MESICTNRITFTDRLCIDEGVYDNSAYASDPEGSELKLDQKYDDHLRNFGQRGDIMNDVTS